MYRLSRKDYMERFKKLIKRLNPDAEIITQIMNYRNHLSSSSILNETTPEKELEYVLSLEIDKFLSETAKAIRQEQIDRMEGPSEEPPF